MNNINQLKYFVEVCKHENFTKAAESLHVSQPTVTSAIKAFERELGFQLFDRTKAHVVLTENGVRMLKLTKQFLEGFDNFTKEAHDIVSPGRIVLNIGVPSILCTIILKKILPDFENRYPCIKLHIIEVPTLTGLDMLDGGQIDLLIGNINDNDMPKSCDNLKIVEMRQCLFINSENPLAKGKSISVKQLENQSFVFVPKGSSMYRQMKSVFEKIPIDIVLYSSQLPSIRYMIENDLAMAILYYQAFEPCSKITRLELDEGLFSTIQVFWKKSTYLSEAMRNFIRFARDMQL